MMQLRYHVHGVSFSEVPRVVLFEGNETRVTMPAFEVELQWEDSNSRPHGSLVLRFVGNEEIAKAREIFRPDGYVVATFDVEPQPEVKEKRKGQ